jgi:hypothetical protein
VPVDWRYLNIQALRHFDKEPAHGHVVKGVRWESLCAIVFEADGACDYCAKLRAMVAQYREIQAEERSLG